MGDTPGLIGWMGRGQGFEMWVSKWAMAVGDAKLGRRDRGRGGGGGQKYL